MAVQAKFTIVTDASQVTSGLKQVNGALNETAKKAESTSTSMAKGFIKAELAMRGVRAALKFAVDGLKEFEKETGKAQGFTQLSKTFKDLQLQVGSVLAPAITQFSNLVTANFDKIAAVVRGAVGLVINAFNGWRAIIAVLQIAWAEFAKAFGKQVYDYVLYPLQLTLEAFGKMPGFVGEGFKSMAESVKEFGKTMQDTAYWDAYSKKAQDSLDKVNSDIEDVNRAARTGTKLKSGGADARKDAADLAKKKADELQKLADEMSKALAKMDANDEKAAQIKADNLAEIQDRYYVSALDSAANYNTASITTLQKSKAEYLELVEQQYTEAYAALAVSSEKKIKAGGDEILILNEQQLQELELTTAYLNKKYQITNNYYTKLKDLNEKKAEEDKTTLGNAQADINRVLEQIQTQSLKGRLKNIEDYSAKVTETYDLAFEKNLMSEEEYAKASAELALYAEQQRTQIIMDEVQKQTALYAGMAQTTAQIFTNAASYNINQIERQRKAEIKAAEGSVGSSKEKAEKIDEINKKMDDKIREQKKKQQAWAIASALIAGAVASMNMWQGAMTLGPIAGPIVGGIQQALLVALTASEVALISSQEFARGGIVQGNPAAGDVQNVKATGGEVIMNSDQQARTLMAIANGGRGSNAPSIRGGDTYVTIQGNADEAILAEALKKSRQAQQQDLKTLLKEMQYSGSLRLAVV